MEVIVEVGVSPEEFYSTFLNEVVADVSNTTGKNVRANHLYKGYNYKKLYKRGEAQIKIYGLVKNEEYHSQYTYAKTVVSMSYYISVDDGVTIVRYVETATGHKKKNISQLIAKLRGKKKSANMIQRIAAYAAEKRDEESIEEEQ